MEFETVIGLEIHVQLNTLSKAFCGDANTFGDEANTHVSEISLAHPGTLPVMNVAHIEKAVKLGLALSADIQQYNLFDRKNYFYPDLPKGYQITQDKLPFCKGGSVSFIHEEHLKTIRLHHIHMEEDAGKSVHDFHKDYTLLDFNRAGVPLLEIVTEPDFRSGAEVSAFLSEMQRIVKYLNISDANMEEGSFRCDCNVSIRPTGDPKLGERCEIKNLNSRKFAKAAIEYEAERQIAIIKQGGQIQKTTMLFDAVKGETKPMRKKESENDYRYFPEPDLPPVILSATYLNKITESITMLPSECYLRLTKEYGLQSGDADFLCESSELVQFYFDLCKMTSHHKEVADFIILKLVPYANSLDCNPVSIKTRDEIIAFVHFVQSGKASKSAVYQQLFPKWIRKAGVDPEQIATGLGLLISNDQDFIDEIILTVLDRNTEKVSEYRKGKQGLIGFFMGQVKLNASGKAVDPVLLKEKLEKALKQ